MEAVRRLLWLWAQTLPATAHQHGWTLLEKLSIVDDWQRSGMTVVDYSSLYYDEHGRYLGSETLLSWVRLESTLIAPTEAGPDADAPNSSCSSSLPPSNVEEVSHCHARFGGPDLIAAVLADDAQCAGLLAPGSPELSIKALQIAVRRGAAEVVVALMAGGVNVNEADSAGRTALITATLAGRPAIVSALLESAAEVNATDKSGRSALVFGIAACSECVSLLVEAGADLDRQSEGGRSALMLASQDGHTAVVDVMVAGGAAVDLGDQDGNTALSMAVVAGHGGVVRRLLAAGASPHGSPTASETPLLLAELMGHQECVQQLVAAKASIDGHR
mmetsp:Transcript_15945/g.36516  ORF Transcript_15945/g.36516 Transcript_15945/m.36516 type:complete len:332 (-) Transcript_15945:68-1063(-)